MATTTTLPDAFLRTELLPPDAGVPNARRPASPTVGPRAAGANAAPPATVVIVVDVLRMTTSAAVLATAGASALWVEAHPESARARARERGALLFGERGMHPLPGFDDGNSPAALARRTDLVGRVAVLCTTNGAAAVASAAAPGSPAATLDAGHAAPTIVLAAPLNAAAAARAATRIAGGTSGIVIRCAGTDGGISLDDVLGAGVVAEEILTLQPGRTACETTWLARHAARGALAGDGGLEGALGACRHGRRLLEAGYAEDLRVAARLDGVAAAWVRDAESDGPFRLWGATRHDSHPA